MTASHPHGQVRMYVSQETLQSQRQCGFSPDSYTLKGSLQILLSQISFPLNQVQSHTSNLLFWKADVLPPFAVSTPAANPMPVPVFSHPKLL